MTLLAILSAGILTMWVPARWAVTAFQLAIFLLAAARIVARARGGRPDWIGLHPAGVLLAAVALWGCLQLATGWTVDAFLTTEQILIWITNLSALALAVELGSDRQRRTRFLDGLLWFGLAVSILSLLTVFSSPPGFVVWWQDSGTDRPTLGPFLYRNQYAAFVEILLPLALVRALHDPAHRVPFLLASGVLFASVVAGGSRAGTALCLLEIAAIPVLAVMQGTAPARTIARVFAGGLIAIGLLTAVAGPEFVIGRFREPDPLSLRMDLTRSSIAMAADRPLTGWGLGTWPEVYPGYARYDDGSYVNQAHNDWAQWLVEGGVPMLLVMLAVFGLALRPALRSLWGLGILSVGLHALVDYPMQQRPALAALFMAFLGLVISSQVTDRTKK